ncbi:hypothetical protein B0T16DRAFT_326199 [Cercophora newfieldiana]|uniref:Protein SQS1 n=1 Tax=Cercophora newfieldiana TaxID=92897 RepID=A0AA39YA89_9PEZI|nr:hypothetical protein B0T16DRAFT_326199 [Cercophora newfieldiana]
MVCLAVTHSSCRDWPNPRLTSLGFTMRDEARNTASHEPLWAQTTKLRQKPVVFVSAGYIDPLKENKSPDSGPEDKPPDSDLENKSPDGGVGGLEGSEEDAHAPDAVEETQAQVAITLQASALQISTLGQEASKPDPLTPDESTEDRNNGVEGQDGTTGPSALFFFDLEGDKTMRPGQLPPPEIPTRQSEAEESDSSEDIILFRGRTVKGQDNLPSSGQHKYHGKRHEFVATRLEAGTSTEKAPQSRQGHSQSSKSRQVQPKAPGRHPQVTEESGEVDDEDAILADYIANMANDSDDDLLTSQLRALSQRELGGDHGAFEISSDSEASEANEDKELQDAGFVCDDPELDEQMEMDDETLARLLAKQELLGVDSDGFPVSSGSYGRTGQSSTAYRPKKRYANNDSVIDAFDDLDLASWTPPPEIRRRRKQPPAFNVSDSELESALRKAWERDRERKKNRKMEREARRASGLLGRNVNPDDLRVKYQEGMKLEDMKYELLIFLTGTTETIQFPPMDKEARKTLHELAGKFKIKSQSTGSGDQRRPVLFRTKRTVKYSENRFDDAEAHVNEAAARIGRKYFHRLDAKGKGQARGGGGGGRGGFGALRYRDGEIAGASVPELGQENKGRTMLEKTGWAKGMGLGSLDNKGILEPVVQVIKTSKAGLG